MLTSAWLTTWPPPWTRCRRCCRRDRRRKPVLSPPRGRMEKTLAQTLSRTGRFRRILTDNRGRKRRTAGKWKTPKNKAFLRVYRGRKEVGPAGLEPATKGL